ncbi:MAG: hypothetical protein IPN29_02005 [Saprospiraceae bacterium]|nr:hypothetical protein [Saprospiraceae bacterium]
MPTVGPVNGHYARLKIEGVAIARSTTCKIEFKNKVRQTSHKDTTGGWDSNSYGEYSGSFSGDFLLEETAGNFEDLYDFFAAGTKVTVLFGSATTGDVTYSVEGVIESLSIDAPNNENVTCSISGVFDGAVTKGTVA